MMLCIHRMIWYMLQTPWNSIRCIKSAIHTSSLLRHGLNAHTDWFYRVSQKSEPLNILQQQLQICSDLNKILRTQDDICYKHYYIVSYKSALTLLKYEFLNNITHKSADPVASIFCSRRFTAARDKFRLGNSAINLLAPYLFQLLAFLLKLDPLLITCCLFINTHWRHTCHHRWRQQEVSCIGNW